MVTFSDTAAASVTFWLTYRSGWFLNICRTITKGFILTVICISGLVTFSSKEQILVSFWFIIPKDIMHTTMVTVAKVSGLTI
jgi:hypothetical protein